MTHTDTLPGPRLDALLALTDIVLRLGRRDRATYHPNGKRHESDTDHTVHLVVLACSIAARHPELGLDIGLVAQLATVHDMPEAYADDTPSFGITDEAKRRKDAREERARVRITRETTGHPWLAHMMDVYEAEHILEARFVRLVDKLAPRLTQALDGCTTFRDMRLTPEAVRALHTKQIDALAEKYPEFAIVIDLILEASDYTNRVYGGPG